MAQVFNNVLTSGLRGRIGKQLVFRVVNGATIVSRAPAKPDRAKETEAQRKTRTTFRAATQWAKAQLTIPGRRDYYIQLAREWNLTNAYTAAIKDYMCNGRMRERGKSVSIIDQTHRKTTSVNDRPLRKARMSFSYDTPGLHTDISLARFLNFARTGDFPVDELGMRLDLGERPYNRHLRAPIITTSLLSPKLKVQGLMPRAGSKSLHPT